MDWSEDSKYDQEFAREIYNCIDSFIDKDNFNKSFKSKDSRYNGITKTTKQEKNIMYCLLIKTLKNDHLKSISSKGFKEFDEAYSALRAALREFGLTKGGVFDGQGNIKEMNKYFKDMERDYRDEDCWSDDFMYPIEYIKALVLNNELKFKPFAESDSMITWKYRKQTFELVYDDEGPDNGIIPVIRTNIDSKNPEHCYFYVNDNFGGNGRDEYCVNELFIDLVKVE